MDTCDMPFFPKAGNFAGFQEHDKNPRKFWFLVLSDGLFTKKTDADAVAGSSKVYIFFTWKEARDKWDKNCLWRHAHNGNGRVVPDNSSSKCSASSTAGRPTPVRNTAACRTASQKSYSLAPKATPPPKRELPRVSAPLRFGSPRPKSRAPVKKEFVLPLFREDTPPLEMEVDTAPVHEPTPRTKASSKNPSLASGSSGELGVLHLGDIFGGCGSSPPIPRPCRLHVRPACSALTLAPSQRVPAAAAAKSPSRPLSRVPAAVPETARAPTPGSSASAGPRARAGASNSGASNSRAPYLYNERSRKLYKDAQRAVEEMADTDTVQVVDYKDTVQCLSAGRQGSN
ncbi:hypothetical protein B0H14DRAFT_3437477 [Mycena olivaceomarginata]|nr:hypothetical protein B0H14DRAFT_3437477 [Mycena olivaceomarginata]